VRHGRAAGADGGEQVGVEAALPGLVVVALARAAGVVDEDIDSAEALGRFRNDSLYVSRPGHVGHKADGVDAEVAQVGFGLAQALLAAGADDDAAALGGEAEGDGAADAAAAARDDCDFVLQAEVQDQAPIPVLPG
jgi:hypothetical protein